MDRDKLPSGLLTPKQRRYLLGEDQQIGANERNMRKRIREGLITALSVDAPLLFHLWANLREGDDRQQTFTSLGDLEGGDFKAAADRAVSLHEVDDLQHRRALRTLGAPLEYEPYREIWVYQRLRNALMKGSGWQVESVIW